MARANFKSLRVYFGERKLETRHGRRNRAGHGGERDVAAHWNLGTSIKIYRCWDSTDLRHYSW